MVCKVNPGSTISDTKNIKKTRILDAAALLFSRKQYHEVMIEDVARLASIAKGTVYNYFSSKEEIYFTIILERMDNLINSLDQRIKVSRDSRSALKSFVTFLYMFMMKYREFFLMYRKETLEADNHLCSSISNMQDQLRDMLKKIISSGIENCIFRNLHPGFAADLILGSIYASVNRGIENKFDESEMIREREETFNFIYEGMSSHPSDLPLANKVICLTRTEEQNRETARLFESAGAVVISLPMLKVVPNEDLNLSEFLKAEPDYIIFMSGNAVKIFNNALLNSGEKINRVKTKIAAVGTKTAEMCIMNNITPDIIPGENSAAGLINYFRKSDLAGKKFLLPKSAQGREEFIKFLEEKKAVPVPVDIYNITAPENEELFEKLEHFYNSEIDVIIFASPSAFRNYLSVTGDKGKELLGKIKVAAIGSTTAREISSLGFSVNIQPSDFSMEGLMESIIDFYRRREN